MNGPNGKWIGWGLGDIDPKVVAIKKNLHRFSYGKSLDDSTLFDLPTQAAVIQMQKNYGGLRTDGVVDYATQVKMGLVKAAPVVKPVYFSVEGHMSNMWAGPVADTGTQLAAEGVLHHQPIGYQNGSLPFDNASGMNELARLVGATTLDDGTPFPAGTPWALGGYSQGMIVVTDFIVAYLQEFAGLSWRLKDLRGVLAYGNPCRTQGSVAPWSIAQAGPSANAGMDPKVRLDLLKLTSLVKIMDVYRKGDIFADNEPNIDGQIKSALYEAIARGLIFSFDPLSIVGQIAASFGKPTEYVWGAFEAIISGISFLASGANNPHYSPFDLTGGKNWVRAILA